MSNSKPVAKRAALKRRKRRRWIIIFSAIALIVILLVIYGGGGGNSVTEVTTSKVEVGDIIAKVNATGRVKPLAEVNIQAEIYEIIVDIPVEEGDSVRVGDLLVKLKQTAYKFSVDEARANLKLAEANLEKAKSNYEFWDFKYKQEQELYEKSHSFEEKLMSVKDSYNTSKAAVQSAEQSVNKARIALNQALDYYSKTEIVSPITGVVTDLNYEVGERTMIASPNVPGAIIMTVADLSVLEVEVRVDETDIKNVKIGQEADITVDAFPDTSFAGVVTSVGASAQVTGGGYTEQVTDFMVKVQFLEKYKHIKPNLTAEVDIITGTAENTKYLPIQAIVAVDELPGDENSSEESASSGNDDKSNYYEGVYLFNNGRVAFKEVELGIQDQTNIQIVSGLEEGDEVISGPYKALRSIEHDELVTKRESYNNDEE